MSPRYILEAIAILLASLLILILGIILLPTIVIVALGHKDYSINKPTFNGWMGVVGASESLRIIVNGMSENKYQFKTEVNNKKTIIEFNNEIIISKVFYSYPNSQENILENINLKIAANENIAFIGPSGSGKTTLTDLILGLIFPKKGEIYIDNQLLSKKNIDLGNPKLLMCLNLFI